MYWKDIGGTVDAVSGHTLAHNRIYGVPIAPIGQTYDDPPPEDFARFRSLWAAYGSAGLSWWSWQATGEEEWAQLALPVAPPAIPPPDPGWPALAAGNKGDQVVWLQQHLTSFDPNVTVTSTFDTATDTALRNFQMSRGLPVTGTTDALTWQAVLTLPVQPVAWGNGKRSLYVRRFPNGPIARPLSVASMRLRAHGTRAASGISRSRGHAIASKSFWKTAFSARAPNA